MPVCTSVNDPFMLLARTRVCVPSPSPISPFDTVTVRTGVAPPVRSKEKLPESVWPPTLSEMLVPVTRTNGPAPSASVWGKPPTTTVALTGAFVVLSSSVSCPLNATPGTFWIAAVAVSRPATPSASPFSPFSSTKVPEPLVSERKFVVPSPSPKVTFAAPIWIATGSSVVPGMPSAPRPSVTCWKVKSPERRWPPTTSETPLPETRRYGPAGTSIVTTDEPTVRLWVTAAPVVFSASVNEPFSARPADALTPIVAETEPATPAEVMTSAPVMPVALSTLPASETEPFAMPSRSTFCPAPFVVWSTVKSPVMLWPKTSRWTPVPLTWNDEAAVSTAIV